MKNLQKGFFIPLILVTIAVIVGGIYIFKNKTNTNSTLSSTSESENKLKTNSNSDLMKCIESDNIDLKYNCALKYAFQLKDPSVCTNVLGGLEDEGELKNSCIYLIFVDAKDAFPDVNTCNLMSKSKTNKNVYFFSDSCYRIVAYDKKDKNICSDMVSNDKRIMCVVDITRDKSLCSGITSAADKYICEQ